MLPAVKQLWPSFSAWVSGLFVKSNKAKLNDTACVDMSDPCLFRQCDITDKAHIVEVFY